MLWFWKAKPKRIGGGVGGTGKEGVSNRTTLVLHFGFASKNKLNHFPWNENNSFCLSSPLLPKLSSPIIPLHFSLSLSLSNLSFFSLRWVVTATINHPPPPFLRAMEWFPLLAGVGTVAKIDPPSKLVAVAVGGNRSRIHGYPDLLSSPIGIGSRVSCRFRSLVAYASPKKKRMQLKD